MYYDMEGNPISLNEWSHLYLEADRIIGSEMFMRGDHPTTVSTVYVGLDQNLIDVGIPLIFETMIFSTDDTVDGMQWRYANKEQALGGHKEAIRMMQEEKVE